MRSDELQPARRAGLPAPGATPVLCDRCREEGSAGDPLFAAVPDILGFTPVPRRAHASGWTPEHQRAFIAALALTGSPRQAARTIGRHAFGAEQLRKARGGQSFADAWDAAMELARDREFRRIHANLAELAQAEGNAAPAAPPADAGAAPSSDCPYDPEDVEDGYVERWEAACTIRRRLLRARELFLLSIAGDPEKRAAFDLLAGPADWDAAAALRPQPAALPFDPQDPERGMPRLTTPAMVLTVADGWLPEVAYEGPRDRMAELRALVEAEEAGEPQPPIEAPNTRQFPLNSEETDEALHDPEK